MKKRPYHQLVALPLLLLLLSACTAEPDPRVDALQGTVQALSTQNAQLAAESATQMFYIEYLSTRPAIVVTPLSPDDGPTPFRPVYGSVVIENGGCCVGGPAGELLPLTVNLTASSPLADVTEMRLALRGYFLEEAEMEEVPWEPFVTQKTFAINVPTNWSGKYASAQFRDADGNVSVVYYDDISVEGNP